MPGKPITNRLTVFNVPNVAGQALGRVYTERDSLHYRCREIQEEGV